jgi:predicted ABC-type ATPase
MSIKTKKPELYVVAGPNGSGKTTFVEKFLPDYAGCISFVNADLIASGLSPFDPDIAAIKAGKIMLEQIHSFGNKEVDFAFETTLSGKTYFNILRDLKEKGYTIHLYFLWLCDVELALKRIKDRVSMGGHNVPALVVRRRFRRGIYNLFHVYRALLDSWIIFDNSTDSPKIIAFEKDRILKVSDDISFNSITRSVSRDEKTK